MSAETNSRIRLALSGYLLPPLITFATLPLLARALGASGVGEVTATTVPILVLPNIVLLGLPEALIYFLGQSLGSPGGLYIRIQAFAAFLGIAGAFCLSWIAPLLSGGSDNVTRLIRLGGWSLPFACMLAVARAAAGSAQMWGTITLEKSLVAILKISTLAFLFQGGILSVASASLILNFSVAISLLFYARLRFERARTRPQLTIAQVLKFSKTYWLGSVSGTLVMRLDQLVLMPLAGAEQLGLYALAVSLGELPLLLNSGIRDLVLASQAKTRDTHSVERSAKLSNALVALAASTVVALAWGLLAPVFGSAYSKSFIPLVVICLASFVGNPASILGAAHSAYGQPQIRSVSILVGLIVNFLTLVTLSPWFGALGAAVATLAANLAVALYMRRLSQQVEGPSLTWRLANWRELRTLFEINR